MPNNINYYFKVIQLIDFPATVSRKHCGIFLNFEDAQEYEQSLKLKSNCKYVIEAHQQY